MSASTEVARRVAYILQQVMASSVSTQTCPETAILQLLRTPALSVEQYIRRLIDYTYCTPECFVIAATYAVRLSVSGAVPLTPYTVHRLFGACLVVAAKQHDDHYYKMPYYAQVLGVPSVELVEMELCVLKALDFRTHVDAADYSAMLEAMIEAYPTGDMSWQQCLMTVPVRPTDLPMSRQSSLQSIS